MGEASGYDAPILRLYESHEAGADGYPFAWHRCLNCEGNGWIVDHDDACNEAGDCGCSGVQDQCGVCLGAGSAKDLIRAIAGSRCERCGHPYAKGMGEWSPCGKECTHRGPIRSREAALGDDGEWQEVNLNAYGETAGEARLDARPEGGLGVRWEVEARWRILTVHHLLVGDEHKRDLRWWNLAALDQRCHLLIQAKVALDRPWPRVHSEWFKPHAAGWYAWKYEGREIGRAEALTRMDELLAHELREDVLF